MLAILAPGQGAQSPGFLAPWMEVPGVADHLRWWSAVVGIDLVAAGTEWDADQIRDTAITQPLLVAAGLAVADVLLDTEAARGAVGAAAGHSVGEFTAAGLAGALTSEAALVLVRERGQAMAEAATLEATGMSAVLGGEPAEVVAWLESLDLTAANHNGAGQIVAAGRLADLEKLEADRPAGVRVKPLSVAGAFHTQFMGPATDRLRQVAAAAPMRDPHLRLLSNADGRVVASGRELLDRLVAQVAAPVRWDACMATLKDLGVTAVIELPPAGTLTGLVRRELKGVETLALKTPDNLDAARSLLTAHGHLAPEPAPAWRIVVAPVGGTFTPGEAEPGSSVGAGQPIGSVTSRGRTEPVLAVHPGVLVEWLAEADDPVAPGQPLARLHPEGAHA